MNPSEVRTQIIAEHEALRGRLAELESIADRARAGDAEARSEVRRHLGELLAALRDHIEREEAILVPALAAVDAWGPLRAARIREEHRAQLRLLATWERTAGAGLAPAELSIRLVHFAREFRADMDAEEADLLHPDVLRDDVVAISQASG